MPTPREVPGRQFIDKVADYLKANVGEVSPPRWSEFIKTGVQRERAPQGNDWWYTRSASLMRKLYFHGPVGVQRLRVEYGGRLGRKRGREQSKPGGGSAIREPLQQLEKAGLVTRDGTEGRRLSKEGLKLLNKIAGDLAKGTRPSKKE